MPEPIIQKSLTKVILGSYASGPATAILDPAVVPQVQQYKRQVASQFVPIARHDISRKIPDARCLVSRKIDGEFNALIFRNGEIFTVNPGGTVRIGLPFLQEAKQILSKSGVSHVLLAGELYLDCRSDRRCRIHDVISALRHPKNDQELNSIRFACFDLIASNGESPGQNYLETWQKLSAWFVDSELIHVVETQAVDSASAIENLFQAWVENESAEGLVVRSDTAGNFKLKPLFTLDAVVIGFTESTDERTGMMHDLLLALRRKDGAYHVLGRVGGGFTEDQRREMLSDLKDMIVESEYAEVNSDHVAYQMVRPEWVVEISCLDLVAQNTRGRPVNRMTLNWNQNQNRYEVIRRLPLASVISPQFLRLREDKTGSPDDVRIRQVDDIVPVPMSEVDATELKLPQSQLLQREVYVKTLRGEKLVRKFLLWKTNKENESENYPAYVAYHADFSPSRKVPLTREVRVSSSETQIIALWHQLKEENIKQGWQLHADTAAEVDQIVKEKTEQTGESEGKKKAVKKTRKSAGKAVKKKTPGKSASSTKKSAGKKKQS